MIPDTAPHHAVMGASVMQTVSSSCLSEYVYTTYNELMKNGWRSKETNEMDMLGFLRLRAWDAR